MSKVWCGVVALSIIACGGSEEKSTIKTPQDYVAEQERLAQEQAQDDQAYAGEVEETDLEERAKWDEDQAELELKRATNSAKTCPDILSEEQQAEIPPGPAKVTLVFKNDGHVKDASLAPPHADTRVGKCILRAMGAVIVPAYEGPEKTIEWEIELETPEAEG